MKYRIVLSNPGGELDSHTVEAPEGDLSVTKAVIKMIRHTPLHDGDVITVREIDEAPVVIPAGWTEVEA